jgi:hypothetical protein
LIPFVNARATNGDKIVVEHVTKYTTGPFFEYPEPGRSPVELFKGTSVLFSQGKNENNLRMTGGLAHPFVSLPHCTRVSEPMLIG